MILSEISLNKKLEVKYFNSAGLPCSLMKKYIDEVDTKYVVFTGDDDYFIKDGQEACIDFLEKNHNFIGCTGEGITIHSSLNKQKVDFIKHYDQPRIYGLSAKERLERQYKRYKVPIFSVFRTEKFKNFLEPVPAIEDLKNICPDKAIADQYIIEAAMVAHGNIKYLETPYLVRHLHKERNIGNLVPNFIADWIKSPSYEISINYFYKKVSDIIVNLDAMNSKDALNFIKKIFSHHLSRGLNLEKNDYIKLFFSKTILRINFIKKFRYFLIRNYLSSKKYSKVNLDSGYKLIIKSIEGKL